MKDVATGCSIAAKMGYKNIMQSSAAKNRHALSWGKCREAV